MTRLSEFDVALTKFKSQVQAKIKANKGGDTWVKIQTLATTVVTCDSLVDQLAATRTMTDKATKAKQIEVRLKNLRTKFNGIKMEPISKYIKEHGAGGDKTRGLLSTARAKADEKVRVALAVEFLKQYTLLQITLNELNATDLF